jgi:hypothetical protein
MEERLLDGARLIDRLGDEGSQALNRALAIVDGQAGGLIHGGRSVFAV